MWPFTRKQKPELKTEHSEDELVFVYCNAQQGFHRHDIVKDFVTSEPLVSYTAIPRFRMFRRNLGRDSFPIALETKRAAKLGDHIGHSQLTVQTMPGRVRGELYSLTTEAIKLLDKFKFNGVQFERRSTKIFIPASNVDEARNVDAWMYYGITAFWEEKIDNGILFSDCTTTAHDKLIRYLSFDREHCKGPVVDEYVPPKLKVRKAITSKNGREITFTFE